MKTAIVLVFDCLPARCLGLYGADAATPQFDRLAAKSVTFDSHFVETVGKKSSTILPPACNAETHAIAERGLIDQNVPRNFASIWELPVSDDSDRSGFPGVITSAVETINEWRDESPAKDRLLYLRATGLPSGNIPIRLSEAGNVASQLDRALRPLIDQALSLDESTGGQWLLLVTAKAGRRFVEQDELPEEFQLPDEFKRLTEATVQVPSLVHQPRQSAGTRRSDVTQPGDIATALLNWFNAESSGSAAVPQESVSPFDAIGRDVAIIRDESGPVGIRTDEYYLLARPAAIEASNQPDHDHADVSTFEDVRLFVKPDDLWDVNNVAAQEPEVVYELLEHARSLSVC